MEVIGAFIAWTFKGFKGKFADEIAGPYENSNKSWRNTLISIAFIVIVLVIINNININKENHSENKYEIIIRK
jgi:hypothetical protein